MSATYRIGTQIIKDDDPRLSDLLADLYVNKQRPHCLCKPAGIEMYIAKVSGNLIIKRMPDSGSLHSVSCGSYEPPPELSGLGQVVGSAIQEDADQGMTALKLDFAMSRSATRAAPVAGDGESDTVRTDGNKLTLRSMLHYLWDEAEFSKWYPKMKGKRSWSVIRRFLLRAAENKIVKGAPLSDSLFIPETFVAEQKEAITLRRTAQLMKIAAPQKGTRRLMLLIGEIKEIAPSRYGHKIVLKHLPDFHFMLADDIHKRLMKRFGGDIALSDATEDTHLMMIATFGISSAGVASIEECALMPVTSNWIPFENTIEKALIDQLSECRRFVKGLRYNLPSSRPLACAVLTDTAPEATAMYVVPPNHSNEYLAALDELTADSKLSTWIWKSEEGTMPPFPPAAVPATTT